ncbi:MAG: patatin [Bacteroidetes bacterium]|jgi:NTE family protein|nr:patatin [Bacteroidota bacterium]
MKHLKNKKIGLALGGGAVLGAAHVGVLKALDEFDIEISFVTGTSIGAFVGAFVAFSKKWQEIEKFAVDLKWMDISGLSLSQYGLMSNKKMGIAIQEVIGKKNIEDSNIPLTMITTDITTGEKIVLSKGSVAEGVMASTCIPGLFIPVEINKKMLVDGGIVENVPVTPLKEMGADYIIGVDLNAKHAYKKPENIIDVIVNSFHFTLQASAKIQTKAADLLIEPDLSTFNRADMDQVEKLIEKGYEDAVKKLKKTQS